LATLGEQREPLVITWNGEAEAGLQDVASDEATQEILALLKVLALGQQQVAAGKVKPLSDVVTRFKTGNIKFAMTRVWLRIELAVNQAATKPIFKVIFRSLFRF
jgi:hypothetical protein